MSAKPRLGWLAAVLAVLALAVAGAFTSRRASEAAASPAGHAAAAAAAPARESAPIEFGPADTVVLAPVRLARAIPLTGTLRAAEQTVVRSKVAGEIRALTVREGMSVRRGQVIARIDTAEFEQRLREREAQLAGADAQLAQARRDLDSNRALTERGFVARSALDRAQSAQDVAEANRQAVLAQVAVARKTLADTTVTAPMDGVVAERFAQAGEKVSPDTRIVSIMDLSRMEIEAPVPAEDVARVRIGQPVALRIEGIDRPQEGRVARIAPSTQAGSRSIPVYIRLDNRDERVRAGMFAHGQLALESRANVIAVPYGAVRERGGRSFVYTIEHGRVAERDVRLGVRDDAARSAEGASGLVEVVEGLAAGDRVVAANLGTLRAGAAVRVGGQAAPDGPGSEAALPGPAASTGPQALAAPAATR